MFLLKKRTAFWMGIACLTVGIWFRITTPLTMDCGAGFICICIAAWWFIVWKVQRDLERDRKVRNQGIN
jgi:hypothetical protein